MNENTNLIDEHNENLTPVKTLSPFKRMVLSIGTLPSAFYDTMTYYEALVWLYKYLNDTVIPTINNNGEAVEELQEAFITLETFISEYFDNLDVQQEINNKLDAMAEDGSLTTLIKAYVDPIYEAYEQEIDGKVDDIEDAVDAQNVEIYNFKNTINGEINEINTKVNNATSGSPLAASSTAGMTDTSRIYVNTTDGKWYYYDGDSWEIGGTYESTSDSSRLDYVNALLNNYGIDVYISLTGTSVTLPLYIEGGKSYKIYRLEGADAITGQIFIEGHNTESSAVPQFAQGVYTFSPVYSGYLRFYNASSATGTLGFRIMGEFDDVKEQAESSYNYINGYTIDEVGTTKIYVHTGDKIKLNVASNTIQTNMMVDPYVAGDEYLTIGTGSGTYYFTAPKNGYLKLQSTATSISAKLFVLNGIAQELENQTYFYTVDKNGDGDYTSFTAMETALANDFTNKVVYVRNGEYDILEELGGSAFLATIVDPVNTNWRDVCKLVPPNTHIIGLGNATLKFAPADNVIGSNAMANLFSPLNISYSCTIENINVYGKNCRYAIHDESSGQSTYNNTIHKYINVRATKEHGTYGNVQCFGSGLARNCYWTFDNCTFKSDRDNIWTVHTCTSQATDRASITLNNCVIANLDETGMTNTESVQFISSGAESHLSTLNIVHINNSYVTGKIALIGDSGVTQKYQLTSLKNTSHGITVQSDLINNYIPEEYN